MTFRFASESPDLPFIRDFVMNMEIYEQAKEFGHWEISDLKAGYHDLNDDGVPELLLWFDVSGFFCGNSTCDLYIFQLQDSRWKDILQTSQNGVWVSDEKVRGWRTLYSDPKGRPLPDLSPDHLPRIDGLPSDPPAPSFDAPAPDDFATNDAAAPLGGLPLSPADAARDNARGGHWAMSEWYALLR